MRLRGGIRRPPITCHRLGGHLSIRSPLQLEQSFLRVIRALPSCSNRQLNRAWQMVMTCPPVMTAMMRVDRGVTNSSCRALVLRGEKSSFSPVENVIEKAGGSETENLGNSEPYLVFILIEAR